MKNEVRKQIFERIDPDYQKFSSALIPTMNNILGVRLPELRKIAKEMAKGDWKVYLETAANDYFEETMLQGMVIGYVKTDIEESLSRVSAFVPKINNWSVCDSFCVGLTFTKHNRERVWDFIQSYLFSEEEYEVRFGVVMLLNYYIEEDYINRLFPIFDRMNHSGFYAKMAVAWAISICYIKFPVVTMEYLNNNSLDSFTYNKALQKITESTRVDQETKRLIRSMKRGKTKKP